MGKREEKIRQTITNLSNEDLIRMIDESPDEYTPFALEVAQEELDKRGGKEAITEKTQKMPSSEWSGIQKPIKNKKARKDYRKIILVTITALLILINIAILIVNLPYYTQEYHYLHPQCIMFYIIGIAAVFLFIAVCQFLIPNKAPAGEIYLFSACLYVVAAFISLAEEGRGGDFYPLLLAFAGICLFILAISGYSLVINPKIRWFPTLISTLIVFAIFEVICPGSA